VWFSAEKEQDIEEIHVHYDSANIYAKRIKAIYRAGLEKWNGAVMMGLPDLGGVMDVAATLRGSENLLMDLYDAPEEVGRLSREIQRAWYEAYHDLSRVLQPQQGYTHWSGLLSSKPSYIIQCDFSYMIGSSMFREFVLKTLEEDAKRLSHTIYHLDGIGELKHLDDILSIQGLDAVQWVPGDGQPPTDMWMDVYERIKAAGKNSMVLGSPSSYLKILEKVHGTPYSHHTLRKDQQELASILLAAR